MSEIKTRNAVVGREVILKALLEAQCQKTASELANSLGMKHNTFVQAVQKLKTALKKQGLSDANLAKLAMKREPRASGVAGLLSAFDESLTNSGDTSNE